MRNFAMLSTVEAMLLLAFALVASQGVAVASDNHSVKVSVGYADDEHNDSCTNLPNPWAGDPGVFFVGTDGFGILPPLNLKTPPANRSQSTVSRWTSGVPSASELISGLL